MTDQEILNKIGLSTEQLGEFFRKFNVFVNTLSSKERQMFLHSLKSPQEAAAELGPDVKPEQLQKLLESYAPERSVLCFACVGNPLPPPPVPPEPAGPPK